MKKLALLFVLAAFAASAQQQPVNVGAAPNDNTGDPLRTAFGKLNANDAQEYANDAQLASDVAALYADVAAASAAALSYLSPATPTTITLSGDTTLAAGNYAVRVDPSVVFDHLYKFDNLFTYIPKPVGGLELTYKLVDSSYDAYKDFIIKGAYAKVTSTTANTVALWGICDSAVSGANCWATNPVGFTSASGATSISDETDCSTLVAGGLSYCLVLASTGYNPAQVAIQIQTNRWAAPFVNGLFFNTSASGRPVSGNLISSSNSTIATYGIKLPGIFSQEFYMPSLAIGATPINKLISSTVTGSGTTAVYSFVSTVNFPWVGSTMTPSGFGNALFNVACTVTAATTTSASCLNANSATTTDGALTVANPTITVTGGGLSGTTCTLTYPDKSATGYPAAGNKVVVSGVVASGNSSGQNLTGYNGDFTVVTGSATQITYACPLAAGTYVSGGTIAPYPVSAVVAQAEFLGATAPGNTAQLTVISAGQGSTNANLQVTALGTGMVSLGSFENAAGTMFTTSAFTGCSGTNGTPTTLTGGSQTGSFVTASSGTTCSVVITPNGATGAVASHGWWCEGVDITTGVALLESAKGQSTCTLKGTINAISDVVVFHAVGY